MSTSITVQQFRLTSLSNVDFSETDGIYNLNSTHTSSQYAIYDHPTLIPVGAKIRLRLEMRYISGDTPKASLEFFPDQNHSTGKLILGWDEVDTSTDDWQQLETVEVMPAGYTHFRAIMGFFQGATAGEIEFRNVRIEIETGADSVYPQLQEPVTYSRTFRGDDLEEGWPKTESGAGTVTRNGDIFEMRDVGVTADIAYMTLGGGGTSKTIYQKNAKFVAIDVLAKKLSGNPRVFMDSLPTYGNTSGVTGKTGAITSTVLKWHRFIFPVADDQEIVRPLVGLSTTSSGEMDLEAVKVTVYGAESVATPDIIYSSIKKVAGVWIIDTGVSRFDYSGILGITASATDITLDIKASTIRPVFIPKLMSFISGENYIARVAATNSDNVIIEFFDALNPTTRLDPSTVADDSVLSVIGIKGL